MVRIVPIQSIAIPANRQRREFDDDQLSDLCDDIATRGLFHPITVREERSGLVLVAGERRLRVITDLASAGVQITYDNSPVPLDSIPVVSLGELEQLEAMEAELSENIIRVDLSWQERNTAIATLHAIREKQAADRGEKQTYTRTAEEIAGKPLAGTTAQPSAVTEVRQAVILAQHMADPEVARAKTARDAAKIVEKKQAAAHLAKLALQLGSQQTHDRHTLTLGDSKELLKALPSDKFSILITDPPYGIEAHSFGAQIGNKHSFDDSEEFFEGMLDWLPRETFRVCAELSHAYVFCDPRRFSDLATAFREAGWYVWDTPLVWNKGTGVLPRPEHGPRRCYECILFASKGDRRVLGIYGDVISVGPEKTTDHPDQKPTALYVDLLKRSARPGEEILDPFAGSGTVFVAANRLQLTATGFEKSPTAYAMASQRMTEK